MRKLLFPLLILLFTLIILPATAEVQVLDELFATLDVPENYIMLTPTNLPAYESWLESRDLTLKDVAADFAARGVLMQCWSEAYDTCFELSAIQNDKTLAIFDVNEQDTSARAAYRLSHYPDNEYINEGYDFSSADWKNTDNGRFLILNYIKRSGGEIAHRGLMRRTIRNGYQITFDMQIHGRGVTTKDTAALNKIWTTFQFVVVLPLPPAAASKINITEAPPVETNQKSFVMSGTAANGVKLTAVMMGLSHTKPILFEAEVGPSGKFKMPIEMPREGVFLITVTGEYGGEDVVDLAFPVTYQHTLLPVNVTSAPGNVITDEKISIVGTSEPGSSIQVFLNNELLGPKKVTAAGKFKIDLNTKEEGAYEVVLVFSKKGLADRRISYAFTRTWSERDMIRELQSQSIKPGYSTLLKKIDGYVGRIMGYKCYLVDVTESGDQWIARMALTKRGEDYISVILVTCKELPTAAIGSQVIMYGTCTGMSEPAEDDESQTAYPCFDLLLMTSPE